MSSRHHRLINILILLLGLAASHTALAQDIEVISANPESAEQGTNLDVTIAGKGFDSTIYEVKFLPHNCTEELCPDPGEIEDIEVVDFKIRGSKKIIANIKIWGNATIGKFDITFRRGGKGTTYFRFDNKFEVKPKPKGDFSMHDITAEYKYELFDESMEFALPHGGLVPPGWEDWTQNTLENIPRHCYVGVHLVDPPTAGRYDCSYEDGVEGGEGGGISIDLANVDIFVPPGDPNLDIWVAVDVGKKTPPNPEFCELLNRWGEFSSDELAEPGLPLEFGTHFYKINFMEGCTGFDCYIRIGHQSVNGNAQFLGGTVQLHPFHDLTVERLPPDMNKLPDVGRLIVISWATGVPASGDNNAFTQQQKLEIEGFEIKFGSTKNNAILAACRTRDGTVRGIRLETCPVPFGCVE